MLTLSSALPAAALPLLAVLPAPLTALLLLLVSLLVVNTVQLLVVAVQPLLVLLVVALLALMPPTLILARVPQRQQWVLPRLISQGLLIRKAPQQPRQGLLGVI